MMQIIVQELKFPGKLNMWFRSFNSQLVSLNRPTALQNKIKDHLTQSYLFAVER